MKKLLMLLYFLFLMQFLYAQNIYYTKTGRLFFEAGTPLETSDPVNKSLTSVMDIYSCKFGFAVLNRGFEFRKSLMQQHFNENYMESHKYPKSTFKGVIENIEKIDFKTDGVYAVVVKGVMDIHGVKKNIEVPGSIIIKNGVISCNAKFSLLINDFNIKIPAVVRDKISPDVKVTVDCNYSLLDK